MTMNPSKTPVVIAVYSLFFAGLLLLLGLGTWQLLRGMEKSALEALVSSRADTVLDIDRAAPSWDDMVYTRVRVTGNWQTNRSLMLDNRVSGGQGGVEIFTPLVMRDGSAMLVNRGWIPRQQGTSVMPDIPGINDSAEVEGLLYIPQPGFTLGPAYTQAETFPVLIQYLDMAQLSTLLGLSLVNAVVVLDPPSQGFKKIWKPYIVDAERHYGYALQWWGLAVVMIVFGLIWRKSAKR